MCFSHFFIDEIVQFKFKIFLSKVLPFLKKNGPVFEIQNVSNYKMSTSTKFYIVTGKSGDISPLIFIVY